MAAFADVSDLESRWRALTGSERARAEVLLRDAAAIIEADLRGARVLVRGRWYEVVGDPRPWRAPEPPGRWWMEVEATRVEG